MYITFHVELCLAWKVQSVKPLRLFPLYMLSVSSPAGNAEGVFALKKGMVGECVPCLCRGKGTVGSTAVYGGVSLFYVLFCFLGCAGFAFYRLLRKRLCVSAILIYCSFILF